MAFIASILFLVYSTIAVDALLKECPPLKSASCTCSIKWGPLVTCSKITDVKTLKSALEELKGYSVDLTLSEVELPELAPDTFQGLHIELLTLDKIEVASSDVIQFQGLEKSLTMLVIDNSFKKNPLPGLKLDNLKNLKSVMMTDNNIDDLTNDWFAGGSKKLSTILLQRNDLRTLGDKAFQSLDGLQILSITGNSFRKISRSVFPSNSKVLENIDLSNNKIKDIPFGLFSNMPQLAYVNLANNWINTVEEDETILKKTQIHLVGNPLKCDKNLEWICKNEVSLDINTAKCDSPNSMKEYSLKVFCDVAGKQD
ncbi:leucine-rich repeat-containing protein 15 isoform X2 [Parasteatoda tepidariorum]